MKKLFLLAAAATTLVACTQNEVLETAANDSAQTPVTFEVYAQKATTRATNITTSDLKNFGVFAYYRADGAAMSTPNFMYNQYVHGGNTAGWAYEPLKFWPNNQGNQSTNGVSNTTDKINFYAYSPYAGDKYATDGTVDEDKVADLSTTSNTLSLVTSGGAAFTNTQSDVPYIKVDYAQATTPDLLYAKAEDQWKHNDGKLGGDATDGTKDNGHVLLTFNHALARIAQNIQVRYAWDKNEATTSGSDALLAATKVTLKKVSIDVYGNYGKVGTFDLDAQTWNVSDANSDDAAKLNFTLDGLNMNVTNAFQTVANTTGNIMIIPGNAIKVDAYVEYDVITDDDALSGSKSTVTNKIKNTKTVTTLDKGKDLTINLILGLTSVRFETAVTDWAAVGAGETVEIDLPKNE